MSAPARPTPQRPTNNVNKTRNGDGFGFKPSLNINVTEKQPAAPGRPGHGAASGPSKGTPGADFMSNEDIRAFSEHLRKEARNRAVERSMDAAQLEARLRNIPDASGKMHGARARARRISRYLYSAFEREFEAELIKIGKGRAQAPTRQPFNWG